VTGDAQIADQRELGPGAILDLDLEGSVVGIEILTPAGRAVVQDQLDDLGLSAVDRNLVSTVLLARVATSAPFVNAGPMAATDDSAADESNPLTFSVAS
jgi:hypothetical protein